MNNFIKIAKGNHILFEKESEIVESLLFEASPLFAQKEQFVIEFSEISENTAKFINRFDIATIVKCNTIDPIALKLLKKEKKYIVFNKKDEVANNLTEEILRALNLPISEVILTFS